MTAARLVHGDHRNNLVVLSSPAFVANTPVRPARTGAALAGRREIRPALVIRIPVMHATSTGSALFALTGTGLRTTLGAPPASASLAFAIAPNPARGSARLDFTVPGAQRTRLELFDVTGRREATLFDGIAAAGSHRVTWEGKDAAGRPMADGVYLARLTTGTTGATRRVVWLH